MTSDTAKYFTGLALPPVVKDRTAPTMPSPSTPPLASFLSPSENHGKTSEECYQDLQLCPTTLLVDFYEAKNRLNGDLKVSPKLASAFIESEDALRCLFFVYGRGLFWHGNSTQDERVAKMEEMITQPECRARLLAIIDAKGDKDLSLDEGSRQACELFHQTMWRFFEPPKATGYFEGAKKALQRLIYGGQEPKTFGFVEDMTKLRFFLRTQKSGSCYLHAPCTFVGYQLQRDLPQLGQLGTVDVSQFARHSTSNVVLYDRVVKDQGGHSIHELARLLSIPEDRINDHFHLLHSTVDHDFLEYGLIHYLKANGVGLLSCFTAHDGFSMARAPLNQPGYYLFDGDENCEGVFVPMTIPVENEAERLKELWKDAEEQKNMNLSPHHKPSSAFFGERDASDTHERILPYHGLSSHPYHSMLLLGGFIDNEGRSWFLLQNWWRSMPLVLVSAQYLQACQATFYFLDKPMESMSRAHMNHHRVAESSLQDRPETDRGILIKQTKMERFGTPGVMKT